MKTKLETTTNMVESTKQDHILHDKDSTEAWLTENRIEFNVSTTYEESLIA